MAEQPSWSVLFSFYYSFCPFLFKYYLSPHFIATSLPVDYQSACFLPAYSLFLPFSAGPVSAGFPIFGFGPIPFQPLSLVHIWLHVFLCISLPFRPFQRVSFVPACSFSFVVLPLSLSVIFLLSLITDPHAKCSGFDECPAVFEKVSRDTLSKQFGISEAFRRKCSASDIEGGRAVWLPTSWSGASSTHSRSSRRRRHAAFEPVDVSGMN